MSDKLNTFSIAIMPDGKLAPSVMTEAEAIRYLRIDKQKADATKTLQYYRDKKLLKATKIGKNLLYSRNELERFVELITN